MKQFSRDKGNAFQIKMWRGKDPAVLEPSGQALRQDHLYHTGNSLNRRQLVMALNQRIGERLAKHLFLQPFHLFGSNYKDVNGTTDSFNDIFKSHGLDGGLNCITSEINCVL